MLIAPIPPEITAALLSAPVYKKHGTVHAQQAIDGEAVETILSNGSIETANIGIAGDWVITNPTGERYILGKAKFLKRYAPTDKKNIFQETGYCRAIPNPYGTAIEIAAPWGKTEYGDEHCLIADTCDENGALDGEPYLIEGNAFAATYVAV